MRDSRFLIYPKKRLGGSLTLLNSLNFENVKINLLKFAALLTDGVTGNTSDFGSEESRFEP